MKLTVVFIVSSRMRVAENPIVGYRAIQSPIQHGWFYLHRFFLR